jgi:hypothetical protein
MSNSLWCTLGIGWFRNKEITVEPPDLVDFLSWVAGWRAGALWLDGAAGDVIQAPRRRTLPPGLRRRRPPDQKPALDQRHAHVDQDDKR